MSERRCYGGSYWLVHRHFRHPPLYVTSRTVREKLTAIHSPEWKFSAKSERMVEAASRLQGRNEANLQFASIG